MLRSTSSAARHVARAGSRLSAKPSSTMSAFAAHASHRLAMTERLASPEGLRFLSSYSSFREPGSLFEVTPLSETSTGDVSPSPITGDRDAPLRADVRTMGSLLGQIIRDHHGDAIFEKIEDFRALAKKWREAGAGRDTSQADVAKKTFDELAQLCANLSDEELLIVSRAFTHFLAIANSAESHHRIRLLNQTESDYPLPDKPDSCAGVFQSLLKQGKTPKEIFDALTTQQTELVLTAHPTEVNRRVILEKQRRVQQVRKTSSCGNCGAGSADICLFLTTNFHFWIADFGQGGRLARKVQLQQLCSNRIRFGLATRNCWLVAI